jgi:hypothetical protein
MQHSGFRQSTFSLTNANTFLKSQPSSSIASPLLPSTHSSFPSITLYHPLMIPTSKPIRRPAPNNLLPTSKLIHRTDIIITTLPQPTAVHILLHSFPFKSRASRNLHIATRPDIAIRFVRVLISIERHSFLQIPAAELGDRADDVDALAPLCADLDGEGEGDCFGVRAGWGGVGDGKGEGGGCGAVAGGVVLIAVIVGVDGAGVGNLWVRGGVGEVVGVSCGDCVGGGAGAGGGSVRLGTFDRGWYNAFLFGTYTVSVKFCLKAR